MIDTINGAKSSAIIYSIVETAKANNLKPFDYVQYLLEEIPRHTDEKDCSFLENLLPWSGKLPGLVRADNIRFTHFSRNPKIAEFLKNYKFVKEQTIDESKSSMYGSREKVKIELIKGTNLFQVTLIMKMGNVTENVVEMSQKMSQKF